MRPWMLLSRARCLSAHVFMHAFAFLMNSSWTFGLLMSLFPMESLMLSSQSLPQRWTLFCSWFISFWTICCTTFIGALLRSKHWFIALSFFKSQQSAIFKYIFFCIGFNRDADRPVIMALTPSWSLFCASSELILSMAWSEYDQSYRIHGLFKAAKRTTSSLYLERVRYISYARYRYTDSMSKTFNCTTR